MPESEMKMNLGGTCAETVVCVVYGCICTEHSFYRGICAEHIIKMIKNRLIQGKIELVFSFCEL